MGGWGQPPAPKACRRCQGAGEGSQAVGFAENSQSLCVDECKPNSPCTAVLACSPLLGPLLLWTPKGFPVDRVGLLALLGCC